MCPRTCLGDASPTVAIIWKPGFTDAERTLGCQKISRPDALYAYLPSVSLGQKKLIQALFTRYRFHFTSDLGTCLHLNASLCTAIVSLVHCMLFASTAHSAQHPQLNGRLLGAIMRFRIDLIPESTVYTISDWIYATF